MIHKLLLLYYNANLERSIEMNDKIYEAITTLGVRDWFDYFSIIVPLLLSVVAIWISISTARKQNKIALFDKRYAVLAAIKRIVTFSQSFNQTENLKANIVYQTYCRTFDIAYNEKEETLQSNMVRSFRNIECIVFMAEYLFDMEFVNGVDNITTAMAKVLNNIAVGKEFQEEYNTFRQLCSDFSDRFDNEWVHKFKLK